MLFALCHVYMLFAVTKKKLVLKENSTWNYDIVVTDLVKLI